MIDKPKPIFDRSTKGMSTTPVEVMVERGRIRFLAQVLGETDPVHMDVDAARRRGYPDLVAPPSFFAVLDALADEALADRGRPSAASLIRCDYRYLLHGNEQYDYVGHVFAGDVLTMTTTVADFNDRKGGALEFATLRSAATHAERGVLIRRTRTLLHKLS